MKTDVFVYCNSIIFPFPCMQTIHLIFIIIKMVLNNVRVYRIVHNPLAIRVIVLLSCKRMYDRLFCFTWNLPETYYLPVLLA